MMTRGLTNQSIAPASVVNTLNQIQAAQNGQFVLQATGGTLTADGTEQTLVIFNEPLGCFRPVTLWVDLDNMAVGDTIALRIYYRIRDAGALQLWDSQTFTGADGGLVNLAKLTDTSFPACRHGFQITLQQTAGVNRDYDWEFFAEV